MKGVLYDLGQDAGFQRWGECTLVYENNVASIWIDGHHYTIACTGLVIDQEKIVLRGYVVGHPYHAAIGTPVHYAVRLN